jgi:hypothetical protein
MNIVCTAFPGVIVPVKGQPNWHAHMTATLDGRFEGQVCKNKEAGK